MWKALMVFLRLFISPEKILAVQAVDDICVRSYDKFHTQLIYRIHTYSFMLCRIVFPFKNDKADNRK